MEHQKVLNLLNEANDSQFVTRNGKLSTVVLKANLDKANEITYNTDVLKSNLCDYNDTFILVRGNMNITGYQVTQVAFKNCESFTKCITKTDGK